MYSKAAGKGSAYAWIPDCTIITHASHILVQFFVFDESSPIRNESTFWDSWNLIPSACHPLRLYALLDNPSIVAAVGPVSEEQDHFGAILTAQNRTHSNITKLFSRESQIISAVDNMRSNKKQDNSTLASLEDDSDIE